MKQKKKSNKEDDTDNLKFKKEFKAEVYYSDKESTKMKNKVIQYHIKRFKKKQLNEDQSSSCESYREIAKNKRK